MLPRRFRLTPAEFKLVRQKGQLVPGPLLALLLYRLPTPPTPLSSPISAVFPKAGLIVSTRLSKKAVVRNLLKRRLRAALQLVLPQIKTPIHLVVLPNKKTLNASVAELESELEKILKF